jgi:hypothetical protein
MQNVTVAGIIEKMLVSMPHTLNYVAAVSKILKGMERSERLPDEFE